MDKQEVRDICKACGKEMKESVDEALVASVRPYTSRENMVNWAAGLPLDRRGVFEFSKIVDGLIPTDYVTWTREGGFRIHRKREFLIW